MDKADVVDGIVDVIKTVYDPEIPVNIYEMGLIYDIKVEPSGEADIKMTLTSPNCPAAGTMPENVGKIVSELEGLSSIRVELLWEPKWNQDMMTEEAKLALDIF